MRQHWEEHAPYTTTLAAGLTQGFLRRIPGIHVAQGYVRPVVEVTVIVHPVPHVSCALKTMDTTALAYSRTAMTPDRTRGVPTAGAFRVVASTTQVIHSESCYDQEDWRPNAGSRKPERTGHDPTIGGAPQGHRSS